MKDSHKYFAGLYIMLAALYVLNFFDGAATYITVSMTSPAAEVNPFMRALMHVDLNLFLAVKLYLGHMVVSIFVAVLFGFLRPALRVTWSWSSFIIIHVGVLAPLALYSWVAVRHVNNLYLLWNLSC